MSWARTKLLFWKELLQLRRDRMLLPLLFIQPVLQLVMFGYVVGSDVTNLPTAIVDQDHTAVSREIASGFESTEYFDIRERPASETSVRRLMDSNRIQVAILLPPGLSEKLARGERVPVEVVVDGSDSKTAQVAAGYAQQILGAYDRERLAAMGVSMEDAAGVDARVRVLFNPSLRAVNAMVPGLVAFILMLSTTAIMSQAVVRERERGTLEQMFVTPITRWEYMTGKVVPYAMVAVIQVIAVMLVGRYWFRVPFNGSIAVAALGLALFMFTSIGIGLLISTVSRTRHQAQQATMFFMIPTMVLSGFIFPIESMPEPIQPITYLIPLRYVLVVLRSNALKGTGLIPLWPQLAAMAVFSVAVFGLAIARFQKRLAD